MRPTARPGLVLLVGVVAIIGSAFLPAGLDGRRVAMLSWLSWSVVLTASLAVLFTVNRSVGRALRNLGWLVPPVVLLTLPAALFAAAGRGRVVAAALVVRALTAAAAGLATVAVLGPSGLVAALESLRLSPRLVAIVHAMLVSLAAVARQVSGMLRARAARRIGFAPWSALAVAPIETLRGFGRLVGALLLRSLERAEALERARQARGGLDA